jgi:2-dehydro-3-deoxyglucarate aldolase/4-hydroxy-2-oxoheptanedioate aldolase
VNDANISQRIRTERLAGVWLSLPSPEVAEVVAGSDVDFVVADTEHTAASVETVEEMVRAVETAPGDTVPFVRTAWNDHVRIKRLLDTGAAGIVAPQVETAAEAETFVEATRYPPEGRRGLAASRASAYGRELDEYYRTADERITTVVQIETAAAVGNVAEISAVDGLDSLFVGPADLSASMDCFGEYESGVFREAITRVLEESEVPVGTLAVVPEEIDYWDELGFDYQVLGADTSFLQQGVDAALSRYSPGE